MVGDDYGFAVDLKKAIDEKGLSSYTAIGNNSDEFAMQDSELEVFNVVHKVDTNGDLSNEAPISLSNVEAPSISFAGSTDEDSNYTDDVQIILSDNNSNSSIIYYTLDNTVPDRNSYEYDSQDRPILHFDFYKNKTITIQAVAINAIGVINVETSQISFAKEVELPSSTQVNSSNFKIANTLITEFPRWQTTVKSHAFSNDNNTISIVEGASLPESPFVSTL